MEFLRQVVADFDCPLLTHKCAAYPKMFCEKNLIIFFTDLCSRQNYNSFNLSGTCPVLVRWFLFSKLNLKSIYSNKERHKNPT